MHIRLQYFLPNCVDFGIFSLAQSLFSTSYFDKLDYSMSELLNFVNDKSDDCLNRYPEIWQCYGSKHSIEEKKIPEIIFLALYFDDKKNSSVGINFYLAWYTKRSFRKSDAENVVILIQN